jgi:hypothetical protein
MKYILKIKTNLIIGFICILIITSCSVTINLIETSPQFKSYEKPLFFITYDSWTKYTNKRLQKAFINELDNQKYSASFILFEKQNKKIEITNNQFPIYEIIKDSIAVDTSDLIIFIQPIGADMTVPGMAITRVNYQLYCVDKSNKGLIWSAEIKSQNHLGGNINTKKTANVILKRLVEESILNELILTD